MTDLHALLKKSIVDRQIDDPRDRDDIYSEAREAIVRRLLGQKPALDQDEIDRKVRDFDMSVADLEVELRRHFGALAPAGEVEEYEQQQELVYADEPAPPAWQQPAAPAPADYDDRAGETEADLYYPDSEPTEPQLPVPVEPAYPTHQEVYDPYAEQNTGYDTGYDTGTEVAGYDYDAPLGYEGEVPRLAAPAALPATYVEPRADYAYGNEDAYRNEYEEAYQAPVPPDRWEQPPDNENVRPRSPAAAPAEPKRRGLSERAKVRILLGTIVALVIVLMGIGGLALFVGGSADGVTVAIDVRREVSDAATAARIPDDQLAVAQTYVLFDGQDPTIFETTTENPVRFESDGEGNHARVSSSTGSPGARILIGPGLATELAGKRIRVRLTARSSREQGALSMRFAYQSGIAISHWQTANLQPEYDELGLLWRVPSQRTSVTGDYLIIEPGVPGGGTGTDIKAAQIDVLRAP